MLRPDGKIQRCQVVLYKRDTYRRTGRGPSGFEMRYKTEQCSFKAIDTFFNTYGNPIALCSRHSKKVNSWRMSPCKWDMPWEPRKPLTKESKQVY